MENEGSGGVARRVREKLVKIDARIVTYAR